MLVKYLSVASLNYLGVPEDSDSEAYSDVQSTIVVVFSKTQHCVSSLRVSKVNCSRQCLLPTDFNIDMPTKILSSLIFLEKRSVCRLFGPLGRNRALSCVINGLGRWVSLPIIVSISNVVRHGSKKNVTRDRLNV